MHDAGTFAGFGADDDEEVAGALECPARGFLRVQIGHNG